MFVPRVGCIWEFVQVIQVFSSGETGDNNMSSYKPLMILKEITTANMGAQGIFIPVSSLSSPVVEVEGIWKNVTEDRTIE